jgi:hypothetical protein
MQCNHNANLRNSLSSLLQALADLVEKRKVKEGADVGSLTSSQTRVAPMLVQF